MAGSGPEHFTFLLMQQIFSYRTGFPASRYPSHIRTTSNNTEQHQPNPPLRQRLHNQHHNKKINLTHSKDLLTFNL